MYLLPADRYIEIIHLFDKARYANAVRSHLQLTSVKKHVFVDDSAAPQTALVLMRQKGFLGGRTDNEIFNQEIADYLFKERKQEFIDLYNGDVFFYIETEDWIEALRKVFPYPFINERYYYEIEEIADSNWREKIPEGYSVEPVDLSFLDRKHLKNFEWLRNEIEECWTPLEENLIEIRGFYLLKDNKEIVSWCTTEYLTLENDIEVGVATREEYRGKGFATIVGSATAECCLSKYSSVGWHCAKRNIGSVKTAEKIGFRRKKEYRNIGCTFNIVDNLVINGLIYSEKGMFEEALKFYQKLLELFEAEHEDFASSYYFTKDGLTIDYIHSKITQIVEKHKE